MRTIAVLYFGDDRTRQVIEDISRENLIAMFAAVGKKLILAYEDTTGNSTLTQFSCGKLVAFHSEHKV
jgi:hypothetical protein